MSLHAPLTVLCGTVELYHSYCTAAWRTSFAHTTLIYISTRKLELCGGNTHRGGGGGGQAGGVGLYDEATHVTKLTSSDFPDSAATGGGAVWLVEFYAPWCGPLLAIQPKQQP